VLIEGLVAPWSASRGVLILGRAALFRFAVAEFVIEETERVLAESWAARMAAASSSERISGSCSSASG